MKKLSKAFNDIIKKNEELIKEGNLRRIIVNDQNDEKYIEVPLIIGIIFTIAAPIVTIIAVITGLAVKFSLEIRKKDFSQRPITNNFKE